MDKARILKVLDRAVYYRPSGHTTDMEILDWCPDEEIVACIDADGMEYEVPFDEIDLKDDSFFEVKKIDVDAV